MADVDGEVAPGWAPVREAVARALDNQGGGGLAVTAIVHGRPVVDLWAGTVGADGLVHTWSSVKPVVGACALLLVERGRLALDDPVADVWPELRAARGGRLRLRHLLGHAAGLAAVPPPGTAASLLDWDGSCAALADEPPAWEPGAAVGEHALTYGHLVGEVVRRVDGRRLGRFLADELAGPLGLDVHLGLAGADLARAVDLDGLTPEWWEERRGPPGTLRHAALGAGVDGALVNGDAWRRGEVPAVNGHATARALAGFYARLLDGGLPAGVDAAAAAGDDVVIGEPATWTLAGGRLDGDEVGMGGVGGQYAGARLRHGLAWAFLTTVMGGFERAEAVERALLACG